MKYLQDKPNIVKTKLDVKDKKILSLISLNSRMPLTKLSKNIGLSRDAINHRIKNYEKKGIIQGYRTIVDISKFGYNNYHLFINLNNPSPQIEKKILDKLKQYPFVRAIINFGGNYDLEVAVVAKDILKLDEIITEIMNDCEDSIKNYEILTIVKHYSSKTLPLSFSDESLATKKETKTTKIKVDQKDIEILKIISEQAKMPLAEIGGRLNLSADAVAYRIKNMEKSEVIKKFIPVMNYASLGYNLYSLLLDINSLDEKREKILKTFLKTDPNVLWAVKTIGRFNLLIYVLVKSVQELQDTSIKLRELFTNRINHFETLVAFEEFTYVYFPKSLF